MLDWLSGSAKDLPVWGQLLLDIIKIVLGFGTVVLVTRWTLSRADRKDAISRQANALDAYSALRIQSLHKAVVALSKLWTQLNKVYGAFGADLETFDKAEAINELLGKTEEYIDDLTGALEEYGGPPGSIPSDYDDAAEALTVWLKAFYVHRNGPLTEQSIAVMIGMCTDLQAQLRYLGHYELNMRLQVGLNPASAWNPDFGDVLEQSTLEFFAKDGPRENKRPVRVIGTIIEQEPDEDAKEKRLRSRRVLILGPNRISDSPDSED
ncbi:MAG: hypothetical protein KJZ62_02350 [Fimbriimonadaceae bacterium]|nr:hypothetical protein [Fimbriimonadaceae bacterium]QOJ12741.1 MAG: hypothetical protein HRU74_12035 [Chthonomonadaceae bacterium]